MEGEFRAFAERHALWSPGDRIVVGVSGGLDSTVLLRLLGECDLALVPVHVHHGLRGPDADEDARFTERLCAHLGLFCRVEHLDLTAKIEEGASTEAVARRARYEVLGDVAREEGVGRIAVGHHRDDQVETVLLHLFRGTGLDGLAGMRPSRRLDRSNASSVRLIRPLLFTGREEIERYARDRGWEWRVDPSNRSTEFRRNRLRREVLPHVVSAFGPEALENVARTAELVGDYLESELWPRLEKDLDRWASREADGTALSLELWTDRPGVWARRLVLELLARRAPEAPRSEAVAREIDALTDAQVGRRVELTDVVVWRERGRLFFETGRRPESAPSWSESLEPGGVVTVPTGGRLEALPVRTRGSEEEREVGRGADPVSEFGGERGIEAFDADRVSWPLTVRYWTDGDRIRPLGMDGSRSVSDLLTDRGVPPHRRDRVTLVRDGHRTVWVTGVQLAHPYRIRPSTRRIGRLRAHGDAAGAIADSR